MIIIIDRPGQLCNRLWAIAPFVALSLKHNISLYVAHFDDYDKYFEDLNKYKKIKIGLFKNYYSYRAFITFLKLFRVKYLSKTSKITVHVNQIDSVDKLIHTLQRSNTINFVNSWHQPYDPQMITDNKEEIRKLFSPKFSVRSKVEERLRSNKNPEEVLVGVHIRRGDYKTFLRGKFYYTDEVYKKHMSSIKSELHSMNRKVRFLLCSNRNLNLEIFKEFNAMVIENPMPIHDLCALSMCDYILGPPSTFSMWASFYNDVPLKFIMTKNDEISLSDFSPIVAQNRFKNGTRLNF